MRIAVCQMLLAITVLSAAAQAPAPVADDSADSHDLTIWVVYPARPRGDPIAATAWMRYNEQTAGSFGTTASNVGKAASDHGQTAGSFGTSASDTGTTAGSYGQSPSTFGKSASDTGQTAGSYGQTAGSFGESVSTLADASARNNGTTAAITFWHPIRNKSFDNFEARTMPDVRMNFLDVSAEDLGLRLAHTAPADLPDILLGAPIPSNAKGLGIATLSAPVRIELMERDTTRRISSPEVMVSNVAPHPKTARAYVLWLRTGVLPTPPEPTPRAPVGHPRHPRSGSRAQPSEPQVVAARALQSLLTGQGLGDDGDRELAKFNADLVRAKTLEGANPQTFTVTTVHVEHNDHFASVELRATADTTQNFAVVQALALLRTDDNGRWHVLHLTPSLDPSQLGAATRVLLKVNGPALTIAHPAPVTLAVPRDGDNAQAQPDLWWDSTGGAKVEMVEWQQEAEDHSWNGTNLFYVPEDSELNRVRVQAAWAKDPGTYRWRVWSVGEGGEVALSVWRTFHVLPRR